MSATPDDASPGHGSSPSKATVPEPDPPADSPGKPLGSVKEEVLAEMDVKALEKGLQKDMQKGGIGVLVVGSLPIASRRRFRFFKRRELMAWKNVG